VECVKGAHQAPAAEGVKPGFEALTLIAAVVFVESPGLCVVVHVYLFLSGIGGCVGLTSLIVSVGVSRIWGPHASEGALVKWPAIDFEVGDYALICSRALFCGGRDAREDVLAGACRFCRPYAKSVHLRVPLGWG